MSKLKPKFKPYIHKTRGAKNYGLFDAKNLEFYQLTPENNLDILKEDLKNAGLTFETAGVVPFNFEPDLNAYRDALALDELQIRVSGPTESNCWERKVSGESRTMKLDIPGKILEAVKGLPIDRIRVEAGEDDPDMVKFIINKFQFNELAYVCSGPVAPGNKKMYGELCAKIGVLFTRPKTKDKEIAKKVVESDRYFKNKTFNACLGKKAAVDQKGNIKHCLWSDRSLGNVAMDNIKDMIFDGAFDDVWFLVKDKLKVCRDCEYRYVCKDCRIVDGKLDIIEKPVYCAYDPYSGTDID
ncbi:MAG: hypothetical protein GY765_00370 [bacterium]|nr:hypothetical protein [bacterium]